MNSFWRRYEKIIEIDSFLPIRQEFEFMRASSYKKNEILGEGFRLRTMRFRGQISQGLLMPISTFPEIPENAALGEDVSAIIGVRKMNLEEKMRTFVRENGKRVGLNRMLEVCKALELQSVPIEEVGTDLPSKYPTVEALLERSDGEYPNGGKKEGIVIRPTEPVYCPLISASLSMKVVNNKYLLKNED